MHLLSCINLFWRICSSVGFVVDSPGVILVYLQNYNWLMLFLYNRQSYNKVKYISNRGLEVTICAL